MPTGKRKTKKSTPRKPVKTATKKKIVRKKAVVKKAGQKKSATKDLKKKAAKKRVQKKAVARSKPALGQTALSESFAIEPGPPPGSVPPVEEPASHEEALGTVTHYYSHIRVAIVQINKGSLKTGDTVRIHGQTTDFTQTVESLEYEHQHVDRAAAGQSVGLLVKDHARPHDIVYLVK